MARSWRLPSKLPQLSQESSGFVVVRRYGSQAARHFRVINTTDAAEMHDLRQLVLTKKVEGVADGWIAIDYIKPFLLDKRKFHFRVYVLLVGANPARIFLGDDTLVQSVKAGTDFTFDSRDVSVHATNVDVGGSYFVMRDMVQREFTGSEWQRMWMNIERIVLSVLLAVEPRLRDAGHRKLLHGDQCYEVLAFDFMLSDTRELFLLEVNRNPTPAADEGKIVKERMLNDVLCVIGASCSRASRRPIPQIPDEEAALMQPQVLEGRVREEARVQRTGFETIWPPPERLSDFVAGIDSTEEWAPSWHTRTMLPETQLPVGQKRVGGYKGGFVESE